MIKSISTSFKFSPHSGTCDCRITLCSLRAAESPVAIIRSSSAKSSLESCFRDSMLEYDSSSVSTLKTSLTFYENVTWLDSCRKVGSTKLTDGAPSLVAACWSRQTATGRNLHLIVELSIATEAQLTIACRMSQSSSTIEKLAAI